MGQEGHTFLNLFLNRTKEFNFKGVVFPRSRGRPSELDKAVRANPSDWLIKCSPYFFLRQDQTWGSSNPPRRHAGRPGFYAGPTPGESDSMINNILNNSSGRARVPEKLCAHQDQDGIISYPLNRRLDGHS